MPTVGKKRDMLMDTNVSKPPPTPQSNTSIKEEQIFDKKPKEPKISLEVKDLSETPIETPQPPVEQPVKKRGRPKMSAERAAQVKAERTERLIAARQKSLETRRRNANQKKVQAGKVAEQKLQGSPLKIQDPPPQQTIKTPQGFAGPPQQKVDVPPGFSGNNINYEMLSKSLWGHMQHNQNTIDDEALNRYGEKIRMEEAAKAKQQYQKEYENLERQKKRMNQMNNSLGILTGSQNTYKPQHRVFGRRPKHTQQKAPGSNPYASCF